MGREESKTVLRENKFLTRRLTHQPDSVLHFKTRKDGGVEERGRRKAVHLRMRM